MHESLKERKISHGKAYNNTITIGVGLIFHEVMMVLKGGGGIFSFSPLKCAFKKRLILLYRVSEKI